MYHQKFFYAIPLAVAHWYYHCSTLLLEQKFTLAAINLDESAHASLVATRNVWLEFCEKHNSSVPEVNPIMMAISSRA